MSPALVLPTLTSLGALCSGWPRAAWTVLKCCCLEQRKPFFWFYFIRPHGRAESVIGQSWSTVTCCSTALLTLQRKRFFPFIAISFPKKSCRYLINIKSVRATLWFSGYPANSICQENLKHCDVSGEALLPLLSVLSTVRQNMKWPLTRTEEAVDCKSLTRSSVPRCVFFLRCKDLLMLT